MIVTWLLKILNIIYWVVENLSSNLSNRVKNKVIGDSIKTPKNF